MAERAAGRGNRATLAMVSEAAGVSMATVSKVLNGRSDVGAQTRARIEQLLREYRYVPPKPSPRGRPAAVRGIDLVFDDLVKLSSPYASEVLQGVVQAGSEAGVDVVVGQFGDALTAVSAGGAAPLGGSGGPGGARVPGGGWVGRLAAAGREGVIAVTSELTPDRIATFEQAGLPLVVIDPINLPRADVVSVGATNWIGGRSATEHLIELGHRRIAFLGGRATATCNQARLHGYLAAMSNAGLPVDPQLVIDGEFVHEHGHDQGLELLRMAEPPTAVFAANDSIAAGLLKAAHQCGLSVPGELSIVGFDDTYPAQYADPPLTTVRQPLQDMGRLALRTLLRLGAGEPLDSYHVELATRLVVRGSTAAPPSTRHQGVS
ncbi:LacI family DNA-binding transcriptional regulator [Streptomyces albicerus]|uniref:LacI family DNA-binding transcriptional regulator n=1 Tax=Streptomyces albicerus TaxID=2569859 RepID=UPI00124BB820|nr:LacI family DNA-binding transcriptional regulator [Streptomyces albicerus]